VARALWKPLPDLKTAAAAWIHAGGSHHPVFSQSLATEHYEDFAEMFGVELVVIDRDTRLRELKQQLLLGDLRRN
jgi:L-arabinose isomerase